MNLGDCLQRFVLKKAAHLRGNLFNSFPWRHAIDHTVRHTGKKFSATKGMSVFVRKHRLSGNVDKLLFRFIIGMGCDVANGHGIGYAAQMLSRNALLDLGIGLFRHGADP